MVGEAGEGEGRREYISGQCISGWWVRRVMMVGEEGDDGG